MQGVISGIAMVLFFLACGSARAADVTAAVDFNSAYVWHGITLNDGLVAQPSIDVTEGGFGLNVWGNFDIDDYNHTLDDNEFSEIDITLSYGFSLEKLEIDLGLIEYLFPAGESGTREAYVGLGVPIVGGLSVDAKVNYDLDEVHGWFASTKIVYGMDLSEKLGIEAAAGVGYANQDYAEASGGQGDGFCDYTLSLGLSYSLTNALRLGANINYTDTLDKNTLPDALVKTHLYGGTSIAYVF